MLTYAASYLPPGLSFDINTRVISGTPSTVGDFNVLVSASDGRGGQVGTTFNISVRYPNVPPNPPAGGIPNSVASAGGFWSYTIPAFTDANGDPLTYTVANNPSWMSFNADTRTLSGYPGPVGDWLITATDT